MAPAQPGGTTSKRSRSSGLGVLLIVLVATRAAAETLATIAADPKHLGAQVGVTMVLHTWGQTLQHHPHVHCVVPGGGPSLDGTRWVACRPGFFLPVRVLSALYRRLFLQALLASSAISQALPRPRPSLNVSTRLLAMGG
jgi:putative transposase